MKLKLNNTFHRLGVQFRISRRQAGTIFYQNITKLASIMKVFIHFQRENNIEKLSSIPSRDNFHNVQSIIDCFEVEILFCNCA